MTAIATTVPITITDIINSTIEKPRIARLPVNACGTSSAVWATKSSDTPRFAGQKIRSWGKNQHL